MISFRKFIAEAKTNISPNELKPGDKIENCNSDCEHYKSKGVVTKVSKVKGKGGVAGNKIEYKVINKGSKFKPGDRIEKTEIQLKKK